ncbi:MAG TPA: hypothetical protein EYP98_04660, partial [Planctomycetes bacterium]|nr:hypothetical protein [Planctomycetota bacterium]
MSRPGADAIMTSVTLRYVQAKRDRHGVLKYWYFRHKGRLVRLPGAPLSAPFMARYHELVAEIETGPMVADGTPGRNVQPGSFGRLIKDYLESGNFKEKAPRTQALYRAILDKLSVEHGHKPVRLLKRRHIRKMRDALADTPGAANNVLRLLKIVLYFGVEEENLEINPAARMKELKGGEWRSWTDDECERFEKRWAPGTMQRRAYAIALYTGQRRSDQVAMTRAHWSGGIIQVVQQKTG